ncbi:MAG: metallophosphoesterase [Polyangiaceae bacterium]|nr:metallophosphoesterase [Myxococcales bacterium]MCB9588799.1 metallophosphoesterase [Polyangiaceae bacterium]MCB9605358.1 metallophosphoesterase [Polyangiaceae bacterium]
MEARTVIVGDVHGCSEELAALREQVGAAPGTRWVFVGDLVARGPDTLGVLRQVRELGARAVLGNHEDRLLKVRDARARGKKPPHLGPSHADVYQRMSAADWEVLDAMTPYLELPEHGVLVVHAGIDPRLELTEQRLDVLTRMRSWEGGPAKRQPSDRFREESWAASYSGDRHVVFGHNARLGLQLHPHATGLDSACVYGGRLSALVLEPHERPRTVSERASQIVSVPALASYFAV